MTIKHFSRIFSHLVSIVIFQICFFVNYVESSPEDQNVFAPMRWIDGSYVNWQLSAWLNACVFACIYHCKYLPHCIMHIWFCSADFGFFQRFFGVYEKVIKPVRARAWTQAQFLNFLLAMSEIWISKVMNEVRHILCITFLVWVKTSNF